MTSSWSLKHSQSDLIRSALVYQYAMQGWIEQSYILIVREKIDILFSQIWNWLHHVHTDARRTIHEHNGHDFSVQSFEVHSANVPLGNHFHKKSEWYIEFDGTDLWELSEMFIFDEWGWVVLLQDIDPEWKVIWKIKEFSLRARDILVIPPLQAHTLFLDLGTKFRWFRPYPFDKDNMDMNPHKLELPK